MNKPKVDKTVRWYQTVPGRCWSVDGVLNSVSWEAEYLFRRIVDNVNFDWRFEYPPDGMENRIRGLCFSPERRSRAWPASKIARHVSELLAVGVVRRLEHAGRCWLEVAERLQYVKGQNAAAGPPQAEQVPLDLPPMLFPMPTPEPRAAAANAVRREEKEKKQIESLTPVPFREPAKQNRDGDGDGRKESKQDHSRPRAELTATPMGRRLYDFIGPVQMVEELAKSGAQWLRVLSDQAEDLADLLDQGERSRATMPSGRTRAMFLTGRLFERRRIA